MSTEKPATHSDQSASAEWDEAYRMGFDAGRLHVIQRHVPWFMDVRTGVMFCSRCGKYYEEQEVER